MSKTTAEAQRDIALEELSQVIMTTRFLIGLGEEFDPEDAANEITTMHRYIITMHMNAKEKMKNILAMEGN